MAAGDLVTADYQIELRTTLMGAATDYPISRNRGSISGLIDVSVKQAETPFAHADGSFVGGQAYQEARTATFSLLVQGDTESDVGDNLETMRTVWAPASAALPLYFQLPGFGKRYVNGWPLGFVPDMDNMKFKIVPILASFRITDPTIYT